MNRGAVSIKTVIVLVILVLVGVLGVLGIGTAKTYFSGAAGGTEPKGVLAVSSEDGKSATITWTSDKAAQGIVEYGTNPSSLLLRSLETDPVTSHKVTISPLKANANYYFRIRIDQDVFDNSGIPYSFKTKGDSTALVTPSIPVIVKPTIAVIPTPVGTGSGMLSSCTHEKDYNADGVVNSLDYIKCLKEGGKAAPAATSSGTAACKPGVDYDGNGTVNSLDMIKCLQGKK